MKKTDYSNVALGQEISGTTLTHEQNAVIESVKAITRSLGVAANKVTVLFGCVMVKVGNQYDQSAGAVVYQDEVYFVDAFSGNHATSIPVYQFYNVNVGAAVRFADLQYRNVHIDYKMRLVMASSGSGEENYNAVDYLKDKVYSLIGVQAAIQSYTDGAIANLVASSPAALDTLNELAAALGDDPNFATTVNNSIALKVAISAIVNNLTSTSTNTPLSAAQGKALKALIDFKVSTSAIINNLTSTNTNVPLSAAQGKVLNDNKANKNQGAWTNIALINGWVSGAVAPQYRKDEFGIVHLRGQVNAAASTSFFMAAANGVPAPANGRNMAASTADTIGTITGSGTISALDDGQLAIGIAEVRAGKKYNLDGITYSI